MVILRMAIPPKSLPRRAVEERVASSRTSSSSDSSTTAIFGGRIENCSLPTIEAIPKLVAVVTLRNPVKWKIFCFRQCRPHAEMLWCALLRLALSTSAVRFYSRCLPLLDLPPPVASSGFQSLLVSQGQLFFSKALYPQSVLRMVLKNIEPVLPGEFLHGAGSLSLYGGESSDSYW